MRRAECARLQLVYMLHAFQKKSKKGIKTPQHVIDLVQARLKEAQRIHAEWEGRK